VRSPATPESSGAGARERAESLASLPVSSGDRLADRRFPGLREHRGRTPAGAKAAGVCLAVLF